MSANSEEWEYDIPMEKRQGQETREGEDRGTAEKLGGGTQRQQTPLHPPPEAPAEGQMKGVKVMLRKIPPPELEKKQGSTSGGRR